MSIASEIERLSGVRSDIFTSIENKGVTVPESATFSSCPDLIDQIQDGGGEPSSFINSSFTATGYCSAYRTFTAAQKEVPIYALTGEYLTVCANDGNIPTLKITDDYTTLDSASYNIILVAGMNYGQTAAQTAYGFRAISGNPWGVPYIGVSNNYGGFGFDIIDYNSTGLTASGNYNTIKGVCQILGGNSLYFTFDKDAQVWAAFITLNTTDPWTQSSTTACNWWGGGITGYEKPYPDYPTTTTGYVSTEISSKKYWNKVGTTYRPDIDFDISTNINYENSPSNSSFILTETTAKGLYQSDDMREESLKRVNLSGVDNNYEYSYGISAYVYSGSEG